MTLKVIGIIGAGQMGLGIGQVCAISGYHTILVDISQEQLDKAKATITAHLQKMVTKEKISIQDQTKALDNISFSTDMQSLQETCLVIEAATENLAVKEKILSNICAIVPKHTLIASNTSSLSITKLASMTDRPEQFMGVHFMNPVPIMKLVELIKGLQTNTETFDKMVDFAQSLGKISAISDDYPAFIVNRILIPMINEAIYTLHEGVADKESIDKALTLGANHPMGPLALADFIGLDTCLAIMETLHRDLGDTKYRPCPLLMKYVEAGWLGKKSGRGFYNYS